MTSWIPGGCTTQEAPLEAEPGAGAVTSSTSPSATEEPQPARPDPTYRITVSSADGRRTRLTAPLIRPSLECDELGSRGHFYYQREWLVDLTVLGQRPYDLEVSFAVRGTTYVGTPTWPAVRGSSSYAPIDLDPPLPAATAG